MVGTEGRLRLGYPWLQTRLPDRGMPIAARKVARRLHQSFERGVEHGATRRPDTIGRRKNKIGYSAAVAIVATARRLAAIRVASLMGVVDCVVVFGAEVAPNSSTRKSN